MTRFIEVTRANGRAEDKVILLNVASIASVEVTDLYPTGVGSYIATTMPDVVFTVKDHYADLVEILSRDQK